MNHTPDCVTEARVSELLDAYGSNPAAWPESEREAALAILATSTALQAQQAQAALLDDIILRNQARTMADAGSTQALQARILAGLPARSSQSRPRQNAWQSLLVGLFPPRLALALATFMIVAVSVYLQVPHGTNPTGRNSEFEQWAWYDITGQELGDRPATAELNMMDLIELEVNENDV